MPKKPPAKKSPAKKSPAKKSSSKVPTDIVAKVKRIKQQLESLGCFTIKKFKIGKPASAKQLASARLGEAPLPADLQAFYKQCDGIQLLWRVDDKAKAAWEKFSTSYPDEDGQNVDPDALFHGFTVRPLAELVKYPVDDGIYGIGEDPIKALRPYSVDQLLQRCAIFDNFDRMEGGERCWIAVAGDKGETLICWQQDGGLVDLGNVMVTLADYIQVLLATGGECGERDFFNPDESADLPGVIKVVPKELAALRRQLLRM